MKRSIFLLLIPNLAFGYSQMIFLTAAQSSWNVDATYNASDSKIECIGRGGNGSTRVSTSQGGNGGGGGAYAVKTNVALGTGTISYQVGNNSNAVVTFIKDSGGTIQVQADYGRNATAVNNGSGAGGLVANCVPTTGAFAGGTGGNSVVADAGAGGGGGGGPNGAGGNGAVSATINGGSADGGTVGQQTTQGAAGNVGTEWDGSHGCGGGGAGGVGGGSRPGGGGGMFGGGGGGADSGTAAAGGDGYGLIIVQWNPTVAPNTGFLQMFSRKETKPCLDNLSSLLLWQLRQLLALSRSTLLPNRTR